jgi:hypothetical protein
VRDGHWLCAHVLEAVLLHLGHDPVDRALETFRSAHAVSEAICQSGEPPIRGAVAESGVDELVGRSPVVVDAKLRAAECGQRRHQHQ